MKILLLIAVLFISNPSFSENIIIFGNANKAPKNFINSDGKPEGILINIMTKIESEMPDVKFIFKLLPWKRAYDEAKKGHGGIMSFSKTKERQQIFDYSNVMYYDEILVVTKADLEMSFKNINSLKNQIVGFGAGYTFGDEFERAIENHLFKTSTDKGPEQRLSKLLRGRITAALIGPGKYSVNLAINSSDELKLFKNSFFIHEIPFKRDPNFLGFAKSMNKKNFLIKFNEVLQKLWDDGTIDKLSQEAEVIM